MLAHNQAHFSRSDTLLLCVLTIIIWAERLYKRATIGNICFPGFFHLSKSHIYIDESGEFAYKKELI